MSKYDPLRQRLKAAPNAPVTLPFDEVDDIVGGLPPSAYEHRAWWSNESGKGRHVQARAWLDAGRRVEETELGAWVRFSAVSARDAS